MAIFLPPGFRRVSARDKLDAMTFHVERIDHVVIRARDVPAMVRFYEQALGFQVERRLERIGLVQLRAGASLLDLVPAERATDAPNMDHLCFRIEPFDRDAIVTRLAPFGISVGETVERYGAEGNGPSVYFHDPEGNQIELKGPGSGTPAH
jgi:glyoxylase I family protein